MGHFKYSYTEAEGGYLQEVEHSWPTSSRRCVRPYSSPSDDLTHYLYSINGHVRVIPALSALAAAAAAAATALAALAATALAAIAATALSTIASKSRRA